jgi:hypothetical protein
VIGMAVFDANALQEKLFTQKRVYPGKLVLKAYETGFKLMMQDQPTVYISRPFALTLSRHLRDVNRLVTWQEAKKVIEELTLNSEQKDDIYQITRKLAQGKIGQKDRDVA